MATKVGNRLKLLWTEVSTITKYELREHLFSLLEKKSDEFLHIVTLNAEIVMQSHKDIELRDALKTSEVLVPDGVSIIMAIKMLYGQQIERIRGIDLIYDLADVAVQTKSPVFLLGSTSNVSSRAVEKLRSLYPDIICNGYSPPHPAPDFPTGLTNKIFDQLQSTHSKIVCVAFGGKRQEIWIHRNRQRLKDIGMKIAIGIGGSLDILSGKVKNTPSWMKQVGVEWLYRLLLEPRARFKRQITRLPAFCYFVLQEKRRKVLGENKL